jgi:hypothetical protein
MAIVDFVRGAHMHRCPRSWITLALIAQITDNTEEEIMLINDLPKLTIQEDVDTEVRLPVYIYKLKANEMLDGLKTLKKGEELARKIENTLYY